LKRRERGEPMLSMRHFRFVMHRARACTRAGILDKNRPVFSGVRKE
jgi:hypothetical protein